MVTINLLPPELKLRRLEAKRNASLIGVCLVVVIVFAVLAVIGRSFETTIKDNLSNSKTSIEKNTSQLDQYKDLQDLALLINDRAIATDKINETRVLWSQVLQELANCTPSDVQFENLNATADKTPNIVLQGNTSSEREIIKFKDKLESSLMFKNVTFKSANLQQNQNQAANRLSFTIEFDLERKSLNASVSQ